MSKIKKNLSDLEMLKNWHEEESFETLFDPSEAPVKRGAGTKKTTEEESFLPAETHKKLEQLVLDIRLEHFRKGVKEVKWKAIRTADGILLTPSPK